MPCESHHVGAEFGGLNLISSQVGGDYFDYLALDKERVAFGIGEEERLVYSYDATGRSHLPDAVLFPHLLKPCLKRLPLLPQQRKHRSQRQHLLPSRMKHRRRLHQIWN